MGTMQYKRKKNLSSLMALSVMICMILSIMLHPIHAASGSITFTNSWVTSGHTFYLYKIADFKDYKLDLNSNYAGVIDVNHSTSDSEYWRNAANSIVSVINDKSIGYNRSAVSSNQTVSFSNVDLGLYLVTSDSFKTTVGSKYYAAAPTLVSVPKVTSDTDYSVRAEIKPVITDVPETPVTPTPENPSTPETPTKPSTPTKEKGKKKTTTKKKKKTSSDSSNGSGNNNDNENSKTDTSAGAGNGKDSKNSKTNTNTNNGSENENLNVNNTTNSSARAKTGDTTKIGTYVVLLFISALILIFAIGKLTRMKLRGK